MYEETTRPKPRFLLKYLHNLRLKEDRTYRGSSLYEDVERELSDSPPKPATPLPWFDSSNPRRLIRGGREIATFVEVDDAHFVLALVNSHHNTSSSAQPATERPDYATNWGKAETIRDLPGVEEAIENFTQDATADNATGIVLAIMEALATPTGKR